MKSHVGRLIWFQHFHKAAGTTLVSRAKLAGESLFEPNANGNPLDSNGQIIPLWEYSPEQLEVFVDACLTNEVTFVATE